MVVRRSLLVSVFALGLLLPLIHAQGDDLRSLTFGQLAQRKAPIYTEKLNAQLPSFNTSSQDEAGDLRDVIEYARDNVDIYIFAYELGQPQSQVSELRGLLDEGHRTVGDFKDATIAHQYTPEEMEQRKELMVQWRDNYMQKMNSLLEVLKNPVLNHVQELNASQVSPTYYWGEAGVEPNDCMTGLQNLAFLLQQMLQTLRKEEPTMATYDLKTLLKDRHGKIFHKYRKHLRAIDDIIAFVPEMFVKEYKNDAAMVQKAYRSAGAVESAFQAWQKCTDKDHDRKDDTEEKYKKKAAQALQKHFDLLKEQNSDAVYARLEDALLALPSCSARTSRPGGSHPSNDKPHRFQEWIVLVVGSVAVVASLVVVIVVARRKLGRRLVETDQSGYQRL